MLQIQAKLIALWKKAIKVCAPHMQKAKRLMMRHRIATTATCEVAAELDGKLENVIPLKLQEKYFDLPSQKPGNRPLWG